jgi:RNA polymerase sigma-70 factor (ECF subfamily)
MSEPVGGAPDPGDVGELRRRLDAAVSRVCASWSRADQEDLVQAAMLKLMAVGRDGEENGPLPSSYLHRVAFSAMVDELRRRGRRPEVPLEPDGRSDVHETRAATPEQVATAREIGRGLRACLAAIGGDRRAALTLRLLGFSVPGAARRLGWPAKRVENLVYRGLSDLRACLERKGLKP